MKNIVEKIGFTFTNFFHKQLSIDIFWTKLLNVTSEIETTHQLHYQELQSNEYFANGFNLNLHSEVIRVLFHQRFLFNFFITKM